MRLRKNSHQTDRASGPLTPGQARIQIPRLVRATVAFVLALAMSVSLATPVYAAQAQATPAEPAPAEAAPTEPAGVGTGLDAIPGPGQASQVHILVLPIEIDGTIPASHRQEYARRIAAPLRDGTFTLSTASSPEIAVQLSRCRSFRCQTSVANDIGAQLVVRSRVRVRERNYMLQIELYETSSRKVLATSDETCDLCGLGEVQEVVSARAGVVRDKIRSLLKQSANITIRSIPEGAELRIDGEQLGQTPAKLFVTPGEHKVEVEKEGYLPGSKAVTVVRGVREIVEFPLELRPEKPPPRNRFGSDDGSRRLVSKRGWGWLTLSSGALTAATGITFLALDKRPYERLCTGENKDENGTCKYRFRTGTPGIIFTAVGAVLMGTGVVLLVKTRGEKSNTAVGVSPNGVHVRVQF